MTIIKKENDRIIHLCPECKTESRYCMRTIDIDVKKREIGNKYGYPEYGSIIACIKCKWQGMFNIEDSMFRKLEVEYAKYLKNNNNSVKHLQ
jgi:hypothetical protein